MSRYSGRKDLCRAELLKIAKAGRKITYAELGRRIGVPTQGPWRDLLDAICHEEMAAGRPDLTLPVVRASTGFPSVLVGKLFDAKNPKERALYERKLKKLYDHYRK